MTATTTLCPVSTEDRPHHLVPRRRARTIGATALGLLTFLVTLAGPSTAGHAATATQWGWNGTVGCPVKEARCRGPLTVQRIGDCYWYAGIVLDPTYGTNTGWGAYKGTLINCTKRQAKLAVMVRMRFEQTDSAGRRTGVTRVSNWATWSEANSFGRPNTQITTTSPRGCGTGYWSIEAQAGVVSTPGATPQIRTFVRTLPGPATTSCR